MSKPHRKMREELDVSDLKTERERLVWHSAIIAQVEFIADWAEHCRQPAVSVVLLRDIVGGHRGLRKQWETKRRKAKKGVQ